VYLPDCTLFQKGDAVYYAGSISRQGTNCEFHLVDERIVGRKPKSLSFEEAAAMPLTTITAWEALYDRLGLYSDTLRSNTALPGTSTSDNRNKNKRHVPSSILIIGGAGGVGSIAIQLAKNPVNHSTPLSTSFPGINVIATASRSESVQWCRLCNRPS
jgi:NADPH:quinone reductase-like Zn-dependent oxidoreductase